MGGDVIDLPEVVRLAKAHGARVMVDDAHGLGVLGKGGRGTAFHYGLENDVEYLLVQKVFLFRRGLKEGKCVENTKKWELCPPALT